ncbi:hypothetical protein J2X61_001666 [Bacillus sp. 3255]|nr:hypothetical protein [Bacillus sp. 3255]
MLSSFFIRVSQKTCARKLLFLYEFHDGQAGAAPKGVRSKNCSFTQTASLH